MKNKINLVLLLKTLLVISIIFLLNISCKESTKTESKSSNNEVSSEEITDTNNQDTYSYEDNIKNDDNKIIKIGLVTSGGGLGDDSFNDMQYRGLINISRKYNKKVEIVYREPEKHLHKYIMNKYDELINDENCDLIIGAGWEKIEPINEYASKNPDKMFVLLDDYAKKRDNVVSVVFAQNEGSFVVGALAAKITKTKKIGFIGGVNISVIEDFRIGFKEGIEYIDPSIELITRYCSKKKDNDFSGWGNPKKAREIADTLYNKLNVDIIYAVAGLSGNGVIKSAEENKKYVIGVDSNQDHLAKGYVLTSMMKRLDTAVFDICEKYINGNLEGGKDYLYGYDNGGISITDMKYTRDKIPNNIIKEIKEIENKISEGKIQVSRTLKRVD